MSNVSDSVFTLTGETIVVLSPRAWGEPLTDPAAALAARAARHNTVVFVEPAPSLCEAVQRVRTRQVSLTDAIAPSGSVEPLRRGEMQRTDASASPGPPVIPHAGRTNARRTNAGRPTTGRPTAGRESQVRPEHARGDGSQGPPPVLPSCGAAPARAGSPTGRLYRVRPRFVPQPGPTTPSMLRRILQQTRCRSALRAAHNACADLGTRRPIVIAASTPAPGVDLARSLSPQLLVYYACADTAPHGDRDDAATGEPDVLRAADLVIAATDEAYHRCARFHADPHLVRFGIEFDRYRLGALANPPGPRPCLGYLGPVDAHVDTGLVERLSRAHPGCDLLFVGPVECSATADALDAHPNVTLLGARSPQETPVWLRTMDACLVPLGPRTPERVVYQQVHAYFAAGKPVVVPPGRAPASTAGLVDAMTHPTDTAAVLRALRHNTPTRRRQRIDAAREADWSRRVTQISTLLRLHLRTPPVRLPASMHLGEGPSSPPSSAQM